MSEADEVRAAAEAAGVKVETLLPDEVFRLWALVEREYVGRGGLGWPLWEYLDGPGIHDESARLWSADFVGSGGCIIFFNPGPAKIAFRLPEGSDLRSVLNALNATEFYVTNASAEYLFCYNHHDVLVGAGGASDWLQARIDEHERREAEKREGHE